MRDVYILSGTLGVGKTTVASILLNKVKPASLLHIDDITLVYKKSDLGWEDSLALAWSDILHNIDKSSEYINSPFIVDCVVDDGEEKYLDELSRSNKVYYFQLIANEDTLKARLSKRGDIHMLERQLEVLDLIRNNPIKLSHSLDTTSMSPEEVANYIIKNKDKFGYNI